MVRVALLGGVLGGVTKHIGEYFLIEGAICKGFEGVEGDESGAHAR